MRAPSGYREVGPRRFREEIGLAYEQFVVGDVFEHRPGRTVSETDNLLFNSLAMNPSPLHLDAAYCETTQWGRPLISSLVTLSVVCGLSVRSTSGQAVANLGWERVKLVAPVFAGDTLYADSTVLAKRESTNRPGTGVVTVATRGTNQDGAVVLTFERSFLLPLTPEEY